MKKLFPFILAASLLLNAAIAWRFAVRQRTPAAAARHSSAPLPAAPAPTAAATTAGAPSEISAQTWPKLDAGDLPALVKNLRAAGFPPEFVRAIVLNQINEALAPRRAKIDAAMENDVYWKTRGSNPEARALQQQFVSDRDKLLREALGPDAAPRDVQAELADERRFAGVAPEKVEELRRLARLHGEQQDGIGAGTRGGASTPEAAAKLRALEEEHRAALARLLTPAELLEYDLRNSPSARLLADQLGPMNLTEAEFRALFPVRQEFDRRFGAADDPRSEAEKNASNQAVVRQTLEQFKALLGPARAADFAQTMNNDYRATSEFVARLGLPLQTAEQIFVVYQDIQARAKTLATDRTLTAEARAAQLSAWAAEATARLTPILGSARNVEAYRLYGGRWLQTLQPRPPPTAPPRP